MKALILAGGFGERLEAGLRSYTGPHREQLQEWVADKPKGLVPIRIGRILEPILFYQVRQLEEAGINLSSVYIQTNARYFEQYLRKAKELGIPAGNVISNGVEMKECRLGPLGDLHFALEHGVGYNSPLLVMASDTLILDKDDVIWRIASIVDGYNQDTCSRMVVYEGNPSRLRQHGLVEVNNKVVCGFQEKPRDPEPIRSNLVNASIYIYTPEILREIPALHGEHGRNETFNLIQLLFQRHCIRIEKVASRVDIGTIEDVLQMNVEVAA